MSLSVKYRPSNFENVIGQDITVNILKQQLADDSMVGSYLFCGPSGCGKTTIARIFANEMNGFEGHPIELDAASNNSVDNVRMIISNAKQRSLDSKYKVFIIDECHAISSAGWQAFLKLIEEPIPYTKFIFCTTNPEKIPNTIITRVQQFNFTKVSNDLIKERLKYIIDQEDNSINVTEDALDYIVSLANNGVRQAITNLEKCIAYNKNITVDSAADALGAGNYINMSIFVKAVLSYDTDTSVTLINNLYQKGVDPKQFIYDCLIFALDLNKFSISTLTNNLPNIDAISELFNFKDNFLWLIEKLSELYESIKYENNPLPLVEISLFRWCYNA